MLSSRHKNDSATDRLNDLKTDLSSNYHILSINELCRIFQTHPDNGLQNEPAQRILVNDGPNTFTAPPVIPEWVKYTKHWFNGFALLLWLCALLTLFLQYVKSEINSKKVSIYKLSAMELATVVFCTSLFQYCLEPDTSKLIDNFKKLIPKHASVIRNGHKTQIPAEDLVIGDLVELEQGDIIPADIRLIYTKHFKINRRVLTGVSESVELTTEHTSLNPLESLNLAFLATTAVSGSARGIVIACGDNTAVGRNACLVANLESRKSPMYNEVYYVIRVISWIALSASVLVALIVCLLGTDRYIVIGLFINAIIALIPEGLIATLIICLILLAAILPNENMHYKNVYAVESLGSVSIICTNKTGTLTMNNFRVSHIWLNSKPEPLDINIYLENMDLRTFEMNALFLVVIMCNHHNFSNKFLNEQLKIPNNDMFGGLLKCAAKLYRNAATLKRGYQKIGEIQLGETNKCHVSVHKNKSKKSYMLAINGDPETVLDFCSTTILNQNEIQIDHNFKTTFKKIISSLENLGENLIAFADFYLPPSVYPINYNFNFSTPNFPLNNYRFLGILSLVDPLRVDVHDAIVKIRSAGVRVIMCSGDSEAISKSVAKLAGIISAENETVDDIAQRLDIPLRAVNSIDANVAIINCSEFSNFTADKLEYLLRNYDELVFAHASPQQKLSIVESCQNLGALVGVIGNDINDCAALKQGDVGISMGLSNCTDITSEVSDIILTYNNFSSIVNGIAVGRLVFDNLKKLIAFVLIGNMVQLIAFLFCIFIGNPSLTQPMLVLVIDMGFNLMSSFSLCFEKAEQNLLKLNPRNPYTDRLVNFRMFILSYFMLGTIATAGAYSTYLTVMYDNGFNILNLIKIYDNWTSESINDFQDSQGFEWTIENRLVLEETANTAYIIAAVEIQWVALIICKTRINSIFKQGMKNWIMIVFIATSGLVAAFIIYCPFSIYFGLHPLHPRWWLPALPFAVVMIIFDECRKYIIRKNPASWVARNTLY